MSQVKWEDLSYSQQFELKEEKVKQEQLKTELLRAEVEMAKAKARAIAEGTYKECCPATCTADQNKR
jgi:hypothetical protein